MLFVSAMFNDVDDDDEDAMDTAAAAAVLATGGVTKADAVPTATRRVVARVVDVITFIILGVWYCSVEPTYLSWVFV